MNRRNFLAATGASVIAANSVIAQLDGKEDPFKEVKNLLAGNKPLIWVFTGDSITHGALHTFGWRSYVEHFAERVRWELKRMNDVVINTGASGDVLNNLSSKSDWRIFQFRPNVVSLMIGTNDCRNAEKGKDVFRRSFADLLEKTQKNNAVLLLNTPNLIDFVKAPERSALADYAGLIRELAAKYKLPLVDHFAYWTEETRNSSKLQMWLNDGSIHPNNFGHLVLARKIFQDLGIFDAKSPTCRLFVP
ncbi:MAG TPA: GDSL-type esterase/lipase family protein [Pyrinomonadaceae bacterium]|nr:GDSL-type esterase/lipase family protein [Pyrinomonadaceae bacterium]